jgi:hypothetical protein
VEKKKFVTELEVCKIHINNQDPTIKRIPDKKLQQLQIKLQKKSMNMEGTYLLNSSLGALKSAIKINDRSKSITYY